MGLDKDAIKESLTISDINAIMNDLGSPDPIETNRGQFIYMTVCHGGDSHKLYYYPDSYNFKCYTGCGISSDIYGIVKSAKEASGYEYSFPEAVSYVSSITGKTFHSNKEKKISNNSNDATWLSKFRKKPVNTKLTVYDEIHLRRFLPYPHETWIEEEISYKTQKLFEVGYYMQEDKITIPQRDVDGNLVGIRGRAMKQEDIDNGRKYMPIIINGEELSLPSNMYLYGLNITGKAIKKYKRAVIYESEKSVQRDYTYYGDRSCAVAVSGGNISKWHVQMLVKIGVEEVIIAFDRERQDVLNEDSKAERNKKELANQRNRRKLRKLAERFATYCNVCIVYDTDGLIELKDAPIDKGQSILEELMRNKIYIESKGSD
ncbi:hypothetical protein [Bacillus sp. Marseille-P3800]|uniref:hypothetical protein n=1 Tax=Bacillus sp. Marseille-P3800 TaxID=2014782 RepID=UPI000C08089E|nr:hypothetical protein [Bacillus sp. Marseille-P3800]